MTNVTFIGAIMYCPCCCTNVDVTEEGKQEFVCSSCGLEWSANVDPSIIAASSPFG